MAGKTAQISARDLSGYICDPNRNRAAKSVMDTWTKPSNSGPGYYQHAQHCITEYLQSGCDLKVLAEEREKISILFARSSGNSSVRTKLQYNLNAIDAFAHAWSGQSLEWHPRKRNSLHLSDLLVTAQPDVWFKKDGEHYLVKVGIATPTDEQAQILSTILYKAAQHAGFAIPANNVFYLDIENQSLHPAEPKKHDKSLVKAAKELSQAWSKIHTDN